MDTCRRRKGRLLTRCMSRFSPPPFLTSFACEKLICPQITSTDLTHALSALRTLAASPTSSVAGIELPPEILDYVDGGRNPDVYTREFVELVQRGNVVLNGKQEAFKSFSEVFAQELASAMPETARQVQRVMQNAGLRIGGEEEEKKKKTQGQQRREGGGLQGNEGEEG
jgi:Transcription factor subunit Med10 of Mediator complex